MGKKEAHVLLKPEYSGKKVEAKIQLQHSLYGAEFYDCYITTRSGYGIITLKKTNASCSPFCDFSILWHLGNADFSSFYITQILDFKKAFL